MGPSIKQWIGCLPYQRLLFASVSWPAPTCLFIKLILHLGIVQAAAFTAFFVCRGVPAPVEWATSGPFLVFVLARMLGLLLAGVTRVSWRYFAAPDAGRIFLGACLGSFLLAAFGVGGEIYTSRAEAALESALLLFFESLVHLAFRSAFLAAARKNSPGRRALIIGTGGTAVGLVREMLESGTMHPIGFVTEAEMRHTRFISGLPVLGTLRDVEQIVERRAVDNLVIALPTLSNKEVGALIRRFEHLPAGLLFLPSLPERITDRRALGRLQTVRGEDLLERAHARVQDHSEPVRAMVAGKRVLITGAGGSIGSVLAKQIAAMEPEHLILVGRGEGSLFELEMELQQQTAAGEGCRYLSVLADVRDRQRLETIFAAHQPHLVFHAAAHKHVPLMERNPEEAVKNNVVGTANVAEMAHRYAAERFVLISTDKAVRPTSVMGASKRVAEMVVQEIASRSETCFMAVRFGNVLGSRGSLLPILEKQVLRGGPITITHPEMTRFFMTIPEAVHLVLQAAAVGESGDLFILDMGEPIKVIELAKEFIRLCGLVPERDIRIDIVGPRPGEKLHEELLTGEEEVVGRVADRIVRARLPEIDKPLLKASLSLLAAAAERGDARAIRGGFAQLIPGYQAGAGPAEREAEPVPVAAGARRHGSNGTNGADSHAFGACDGDIADADPPILSPRSSRA